MLLRYFAAARASAGCEEETVELAQAIELTELWALLANRHSASASPSAPALEVLLPRCSFLRNGVVFQPQPGAASQLEDHDVVDVLPPFAGG